MYRQFWQDRVKNIRIVGNQINGDCPFCNRVKHFYANINTGQFDCKLCGIFGNAISYLVNYEHMDNKQVAECLNSYSINENNYNQPVLLNNLPKKIFEQSLVDEYVFALSEEKLKAFSEERGLPIEILKKYKLGIDKEGNFTLPVYDAEGKIRDIRRKRGKDTISSSGASIFLFGIQNLINNDRVYLTEGEWSKMALEAQGYPSVGVPGASVFKDEWIDYFRGKKVYIVYDLDSGGENGAKKVATKLSSVVKEIRVIRLPKELGEGKDVRNFFNNGGNKEQFEELIKKAEVINNKRSSAAKLYNLTDLGNAERLVNRHKDNLRYCHPWRKWLVWDGKCWATDDTAEAWRYAIETVRHIYAEAEDTQEGDKRKHIGNHALKSESEVKIKAMLSLAEKQEGIPVKPEDLDKDPWLLNVLNGTIDLRSGEFKPHSKEDFITKLAPVSFDPHAICPNWIKFLQKVMVGNESLIKFLQRIAGYCLTGRVSEQKLFFLFGSGANGKSTFLKVLQGILGDYAIKAASEILISKPVDGHTTSITDLKGARLAITVEIQEGRHLAEALVKELTGGDSITARRMRQDNMTFEPTHKIILAANHKPVVHETIMALWRRIDLIPFNYVFSEDERIKDYHEILLNEEKEGILLWAIEGCREWQKIGLKESQEVLEATREYRNEMDILGEFIEDCFVIGQKEETTNEVLRNAYENWCKENGEKPVSPKTLSSRLQEKGFIKIINIKTEKGRSRGWQGFKIKDIAIVDTA